MNNTPEFLAEFAVATGIDPREWRVWHTASMLSVSGIGEQTDALALQNFLKTRMGMEAEINEPVQQGGTWGVVAIPIPKTH